jgi:UDP-glucose:(heptosyl)LPS alpha-1,3-glucosyltransferase
MSFTLLIGGSPKTGPYERLARRLGVADRVRFLGYRPDVRECYFAADLLVHPTFYDPCALVTLEALACGLPVLTTVYNGAHELLPPPLDQAVIDDPHDAHLLAHRIQQWWDPRLRAAGTRAARQAAAAWTFEDHYRALLAVLEEAAARKRAA